MWTQDYLLAITEYHQILKLESRMLLSFLFGTKSNCGWYQVLDSIAVVDILGCFNPASYSTWYFRYHNDGWRPSTEQACADATTFDIRTAKQYEPDFVAFSRAVCCLELLK
jgi:hypothetical protein